MNLFRRIRHRIAHLFGLNCGRVETWWEHPEHGRMAGWTSECRLMVGFRCTCGKLSGVHEIKKGRL